MKKYLDKLTRRRDEGPGEQPSYRLPDPQGLMDEEDLESSEDLDVDVPTLGLLGYDPDDDSIDVEVDQKEINKRDKKSTEEALDIATTDLSGDTMRGHGSLMEELLERVPKAPSIDEGEGFTLQHRTKQINPLHDTKRRQLREGWDQDEHYTEKLDKMDTKLDKLEGKGKRDKGLEKKRDRNIVKRREVEERIEGFEDITSRIQLNEEQLEAVEKVGWDDDPSNLQLTPRLKNGPGLSPDELSAIDILGSTAQGMSWLSWAGLYSIGRAVSYLENGKFYDWLRLEAETRIELASIAYDWGIGKDEKTPAYTLGRHFVLRTGEDEEDRLEAEEGINTDIRNAFVDTMLYEDPTEDVEKVIESGAVQAKTHGVTGAIKQHTFAKTDRKRTDVDRLVGENSQAIRILEKVFILLQAGLQIYDDEQQEHVDLDGVDVCRALGHGGRVNIRIPQIEEGQTGHELTDWLGITKENEQKVKGVGGAVVSRGFGTHHMDIGKNTDEGLGDFFEDGEGGAALRSFKDTRLWGVNLSAGGLGNRDHNGDVILPDGSHGHMFISFKPPEKDRDGALQIGMETTGPGAGSLVGYVHDKNSTESTANPESSFGGHKSDKVGDGSPRKVTRSGLVTHSEDVDSWESTNSRFVDLRSINGGDWMTYLTQLHSTFEEMKEDDPRQALETLVGPRGGLEA